MEPEPQYTVEVVQNDRASEEEIEGAEATLARLLAELIGGDQCAA